MGSNAPGGFDEFIWGKSPENKIKGASLFTSQQNQLFQLLMQGLLGGGQGGGPQLLSLAGLDEFTRSLAQPGMSAADRTYLSETVDKPLIKNFKEEILPGISRGYGAGGGFYGSERIKSEQKATEGLGQSIAGERARYASGKESERSQQLLGALGLRGQLEQSRVQALLQALGVPQKENIAFQTEGTEGLWQNIMGIIGQFAGGMGAGVGFAGSDERLKTNVELINKPLEKLSNLRGVTWDWNEEGKKLPGADYNVGVIAQEVEQEYPNLVEAFGPDAIKHVNYHGLVGVAVEGIKELTKRVEALEA